MEVFTKTLEKNGIAKRLVDQNMGVEIRLEDNVYSLREDIYGRLVVTSIEKMQLFINPRSSNSIEISADWKAEGRGET